MTLAEIALKWLESVHEIQYFKCSVKYWVVISKYVMLAKVTDYMRIYVRRCSENTHTVYLNYTKSMPNSQK